MFRSILIFVLLSDSFILIHYSHLILSPFPHSFISSCRLTSSFLLSFFLSSFLSFFLPFFPPSFLLCILSVCRCSVASRQYHSRAQDDCFLPVMTTITAWAGMFSGQQTSTIINCKVREIHSIVGRMLSVLIELLLLNHSLV